MNTVPQISIIVPVYNVEKYLSQCIDSLLAQTGTDYEILLIDDGSNDSSGTICDKYASENCNVRVFHKPNGGVSSARNVGIENARGRWISFVDSDDYVAPNYWEKIKESMDARTELLFFSSSSVYDNGDKCCNMLRDAYVSGKEAVQREIYHLKCNVQRFEFFGYTWNKVFRTDIIKNFEIRFVEGLSLKEDEVFTWDYISHANSIKTVSSCLYNYRAGMDGGLTAISSKQKKMYVQLVSSLQRSQMVVVEDMQLKQLCDKELLYYYAKAITSVNIALSERLSLYFKGQTYRKKSVAKMGRLNFLIRVLGEYFKRVYNK